MRRKHSGPRDDAEINMTPMLDIVFIMLIFFIVTATFVKEFGLDASRPSDQPDPDPSRRSTISLSVGDDCWVRLDGRRLDPERVAPNVQRLLGERPGAGAVLTLEGRVLTECATRVMDQIRLGGVASVSLRHQEVVR